MLLGFLKSKLNFRWSAEEAPKSNINDGVREKKSCSLHLQLDKLSMICKKVAHDGFDNVRSVKQNIFQLTHKTCVSCRQHDRDNQKAHYNRKKVVSHTDPLNEVREHQIEEEGVITLPHPRAFILNYELKQDLR
jgi:hypothetical protein